MPLIPTLQEVEAGRFLRSRPAWSTKQDLGQSGLNRKTLSKKTKPTINYFNKQIILGRLFTFHLTFIVLSFIPNIFYTKQALISF